MAATAIETETSAFLSAEKVEELHAIWEKTLEDFIKEQEQKKGSGLNATRLRQLGKKANEVQQKVFGHVRTFLPPPPPPELEPVQGSKAFLEQEEAAKEEEEKRKQQEREMSQHLSSDFEQTINDLFVIDKPLHSESVPISEPDTVSKSEGEERQATTEGQLREAIRSRQEKLALIEKTVPLALKEITHQLFSRHLISFVEASTSPQYAVDEATLQEGFQLKTASDPEIVHLKQTLFSVYSGSFLIFHPSTLFAFFSSCSTS